MNTYIEDARFAINFATIMSKSTERDVFWYLVNNGGKFVGSYAILAEHVTGNRRNASNMRVAALSLMDKGIIYVESDERAIKNATTILLNPDWKTKFE